MFRKISLLLLLPLLCNAQKKEYSLLGSLGVESGETFNYQLVFTDSVGYIKGYAVTYMVKEKDTRAAITGTLNRETKTLNITETEILYNNGFRSLATICLIQSSLKYRKEGNSFVLVGPVVSKDVGNAHCSSGSIRFENSAALDELFKVAAPPPPPPPAIPKDPPRVVVVDKTKPARPTNNPSVNRPVEITEGKDKIYEWVSDTIIFEIRDGGKIDGDVVSVSFNNNIVLHNYTLTKGVKRILLPLSGKEVDTITVIAGNEGNEPPNTADIMLQDGDRLYEIIAHNKIGKKANILIRRKK